MFFTAWNVGWVLQATKGYAAKVVNPGGVEIWKSGGGDASGLLRDLDEFLDQLRILLEERAVDDQ